MAGFPRDRKYRAFARFPIRTGAPCRRRSNGRKTLPDPVKNRAQGMLTPVGQIDPVFPIWAVTRTHAIFERQIHVLMQSKARRDGGTDFLHLLFCRLLTLR